MATTTNYGWTTPDDTSLVKDGAAAIRTLGTSVDTTTKNLNPSTTLGDIEYRSSTSNTNTRVGIGSSGQNLTVVGGVPSWAASATSVLTTTGDTLYASAANTLARLGVGTTGQVLTVAGGLPSWATPASSGFQGCMIWNSTNQSLSNNSFTTITFDSEEYDVGGYHDNSVNNSRITIPTGKDGYYHVQGMISYASNAANQRAGRFVISDGRLFANFAGQNSGSTYGSSIYFATTFYLDASDYIEMRGLQNSGGSLNVESQVYSTFMSATYLGA